MQIRNPLENDRPYPSASLLSGRHRQQVVHNALGQTSGHSSYYFLDIGIMVAGALLVFNGDLLLGGMLFVAGSIVHFDWLGMGIFK